MKKQLFNMSFSRGTIMLILLLGINHFSYSQQEAPEWDNLSNFDGIEVDYSYQTVTPNGREEVLVLFRFTNTNSTAKELSWIVKEYRNNNCYNCDQLDDNEYAHSIQLQPRETKQADGSSKQNKALYIFSHFVKRVPGMTDTHISDFEFINVTVTDIQ